MASVRNLRKRKHSEDVGHKIVFNKYCKEGQIINDKLLPDSIQKSSYKELFTACVEELFIANIDSKQFASKLVKLFGDYTTLQVKTQNVLKKFLGKLCEACGGACKNFISTERIDKCPNCDEDSGEKEVGSEPVPKKVIARHFVWKYFLLSLQFRFFFQKNKNKAPTLKRLESPRKSLRPQKAGFAASINKNCNVGKDDTNDKLLLTESIHYFKWKELFEKCVEELKQVIAHHFIRQYFFFLLSLKF